MNHRLRISQCRAAAVEWRPANAEDEAVVKNRMLLTALPMSSVLLLLAGCDIDEPADTPPVAATVPTQARSAETIRRPG
jgi:hypothetical protein